MPRSAKQHRYSLSAANNKQQASKQPSKRATASQRGYGYKWQKARAVYIAHNPLCATCLKSGVTTAARVVDHVEPHRGDQDLFWDIDNWQPLCIRCHNRKTASGK